MKKQRGSAIVISMLLIAALGVITFGIGRLLLVLSNTNALYENGSVAYYAAESGLEEGFLRYRYNQNAEVPFLNWKLNESKVFKTTYSPTSASTTKTGMNYEGVELPKLIPADEAANQTYTLRMGYLGTENKKDSTILPIYGLSTIPFSSTWNYEEFKRLPTTYAEAVRDYGSLVVPRNESVKISLDGVNLASNAGNLHFYARFFDTGINSSSDLCKALVEVRINVKDVKGDHEYKEVIKPETVSNCDGIVPGFSGINSFRTLSGTEVDGPDMSPFSITYKYNRLQDVITNAGGSTPMAGDEVTLSIKPLFYNTMIGLVREGCTAGGCNDKSSVIAGPYTRIVSTGYFADVAKRLQANIDRQSGTLYDLYDYVIFSSN